MCSLIFVPAMAVFLVLIIGLFISTPGYKGPASEHFSGSGFKNYDNISAKGFLEVIKWMISRKQGKWEDIPHVETAKPNPSEDSLTIYFVNHATFMIQWHEKNILTDPIWSERCSPFKFVGPKRIHPPGISFDNLPKIDLVLISHNHYDHLDIATLQKLYDRDKPSFIVPLGIDLYLKNEKIMTVKAMDWWESQNGDELRIDMVPAQHFSGRGMFDRDLRLWGGYMLSDGEKKVYFAGDTGYNEKMFDDIKLKHPHIDVALLPIGAYKPRWFMAPIHISPDEAVVIHKQLNCKKSIGMHYGTFPLADDGQHEPEADLKESLEKRGFIPEDFVLLNPGEKF